MVPGLDADILHRQGEARLIAEDGLVLRPVVLEDPVDVLQPGAEEEVEEEDDDLQEALHHVPAPEGEVREEVQHPARQEGGQHQEEEDGHAHPQHHGEAHDGALQLLAGEVLLQPQVKF